MAQIAAVAPAFPVAPSDASCCRWDASTVRRHFGCQWSSRGQAVLRDHILKHCPQLLWHVAFFSALWATPASACQHCSRCFYITALGNTGECSTTYYFVQSWSSYGKITITIHTPCVPPLVKRGCWGCFLLPWAHNCFMCRRSMGVFFFSFHILLLHPCIPKDHAIVFAFVLSSWLHSIWNLCCRLLCACRPDYCCTVVCSCARGMTRESHSGKQPLLEEVTKFNRTFTQCPWLRDSNDAQQLTLTLWI